MLKSILWVRRCTIRHQSSISVRSRLRNPGKMQNLNSMSESLDVVHNSDTETSPDPFVYTSGRWLHHDEMQRKARFLKFDFPLLCQKAVDVCPGAQSVLRYEKKEGGFNRVFILHMDNGTRVVARLPFRVAGPASLTTHSEVATIAYVKSHTSIPVPRVLDWACDENNQVGAEYIIMEHAEGVQLHDIWPTMDSHQHMLVTKALAKAATEMANIAFPAYGSLYFDNPAIGLERKIEFADGFVIGPQCGREYWDCLAERTQHRYQRSTNRGPWTTLEEYTEALLEAGHLRLLQNRREDNDELPYRGAVQEHVRLLEISRTVLMELIKSPLIREVSAGMLLHPDLNKRNIYVSPDDPTHITALIDWQSTCIEPTFVYANETPDLIASPPNLSSITEMEEEFLGRVDDPKEREKLERDCRICQQTFEVTLCGFAPKLAAARATDETLLRSLRYCHSSYRDGAAALRQELIELSQRWSELGLPNICPYQPSTEDLAEHAKQWQDFETTQKFKLFLMHMLDSNSDGWVPTESWDAAKAAHKAAFEQWMETVRGSEDPDMNEDRGRNLWPWDER